NKLTPDSVNSSKIANGTIIAVDVDSSQIQLRVIPDCPTGQAIQGIAQTTGAPTCVAVGGGGGTVTSVQAGANGGLQTSPPGGITTTGTISVATGGITNALLAPNAVDSSKILNLSVATEDLAEGAVTLNKLAADSVDSSKIAPNTITAVDVNSSQIQLRVTPNCLTGQAIQSIAQTTGAPTCVAVGSGTGTSLTATPPLAFANPT